MPEGVLLKLDGVSKRFGRTCALAPFNLELKRGRIHGLAGENGAGKSTLVKLICGVHVLDSGRMELDGRGYAPSGPAEADAAGVSVFHQEIPICPNLSVAANVFLGEKMGALFPDWRRMEAQCEDWFLRWLDIRIDPRRLLRDCTASERQMTLLVRCLSREARLIILDEPTTALTPVETRCFFEVIRRLAGQGVSFLFVSHFLNELVELCDRIDVLRDGHSVGVLDRSEFDAARIASLIAGRAVNAALDAAPVAPGPAGLQVRSLTRPGAFADVSFDARRGEVLGIAGLQGSGRSALARALFGAPPALSGEIRLEGQQFFIRSPREALAAGIGYVPEDRREFGLFDHLDVRSNLGLLHLRECARGGMLSLSRLTNLALEMQRRLQIRMPSPDAAITSLSGGNQQKVLIARWLAVHPRVLVMNEPTRGVDVGAKEEIVRLLRELARDGCAVIVASSDLDELLHVADRILVMAGGRLVREFHQGSVNKAQLLESLSMQ